jgi:LysM repeat protein
VCSGDTLARIARRYNTSIQKLMQANNMTQAQANRLKIGQRILLPRN